MIYLIDDKRLRQSVDYNWTEQRFNKFRDYIQCIYTLEELKRRSSEIFLEGNTILYHESFIDQTFDKDESIDRRNKLTSWCEKKENQLVYFSGSKDQRKLKDNIAFLPVSVLYSNLEIFLNKTVKNEINLKYLLYGNNIHLEEYLLIEQIKALNSTFEEASSSIDGRNLFIRPINSIIHKPILNAEIKDLIGDYSDKDFLEHIEEWLNNEKYDNIFLPLCIGDVLSDYIGLRFATLIRCLPSKNQLSRIYIYSFVGIEHLIYNPFFNILKTKNIELIPFSKNAFAKSALKQEDSLTQLDLTTELDKLKLDIPGNYFDSHHIANEWGIYQMARNANIKIEEVKNFETEKLNTVYFKWLIAKNSLYDKLPEGQIEQQKKYAFRLNGLRVMGKIDL